MKLDDLRTQWRMAMADENALAAPQLDRLRDQVAKIRRGARMRNFWMIVPLSLAIPAAVLFDWWTRGDVGLFPALGAVFSIMLAASATFNLLRARRLIRSDERALRASVEAEI